MAPPSKKRDKVEDNDDFDESSYIPLAKKGRGGTSSSSTTILAAKPKANATTTTATSPGVLIHGASTMSILDRNNSNDSSSGSVNGAITRSRGRAIRNHLFQNSHTKLNAEICEHAKKRLAIANKDLTTITSKEKEDLCAIQIPAIENYLSHSSHIQNRYNRNYGDIVVFGDGQSNQLGMGYGITESRTPRVLVNLRNLPITMLACGGMHSLALTNDGRVYSWGCNDEGSLGWETTEEKDDGALPDMITGFHPSKYGPNRASSSSRNEGNNNGATSSSSSTTDPKEDVFIELIAAGNTQSFFLSSTGDVFMCGTYKDGETGKFRHLPPKDDTRTLTGYKDMSKLEEDDDPKFYHPPRWNQDWPVHVIDMPPKVKDISAGETVNAALCEDGTFVTWGLGTHGELARPVPKLDKKTSMDVITGQFLMPKPPLWDGPRLLDRKVLSMSCGAYHLLVVTNENGAQLNVYSSGVNNYGQLGHGDTENRSVLTKIQDLVGVDITKVSAGDHFSCFVDSTGRELYSCGRGDYGQLGITLNLPKEGYFETRPCRVPIVYEPDLEDVDDPKVNCITVEDIVEDDQPIIKQISCGGNHVLVLTEGGDAYSWGYGECGACGQGKSDDDVFRPKKVEKKIVKTQGASNYKFQYVSGGGQHSAAIVKTSSTGFVS
jgi:regulator of chromosome condensation